MARPRLGVGQAGSVTLTPERLGGDGRWSKCEPRRAQRWSARCYVRDRDGKRRLVQRIGASKPKAEAALKAHLTERSGHGGNGVVTSSTLVADTVAMWLEWFKRPERNRAPRTIRVYEQTVDAYVLGVPGIRDLTLSEANAVQAIERWLQTVADDHGAGAAKSARSVLSNVLTWAVRNDALSHNAVRHLAATPKPATPLERKVSERRRKAIGEDADASADRRRALTDDERRAFLSFLETDGRANRPSIDIAEPMRFLAGTGVRFSEMLDLTWQDVDLSKGTAHVLGTKTVHSDRRVQMPAWLVDMLSERRKRPQGQHVHVFASPRTGQRRDERSAWRSARTTFDRAGFPWLTSHGLRRTVATRVAAAHGVALAADQLGHADPSMTARVYLGRGGNLAQVADVL